MIAGWIAEMQESATPIICPECGPEIRSQEAARSDYLPTDQEHPPMRTPVFPPIPANSEITRGPTGGPLLFVG